MQYDHQLHYWCCNQDVDTVTSATAVTRAITSETANVDTVTPAKTSQEDVVEAACGQTEEAVQSGQQSETTTTIVTSTSMTTAVQDFVPNVGNEVIIDDTKSDTSITSSRTTPESLLQYRDDNLSTTGPCSDHCCGPQSSPWSGYS